MSSSIGISLAQFLIRIPAVLIALTFHEVAHGYMAFKLGDPTARSLGRLSLNPLRHLDPIGALCLLVFNFGWAKPVPINTRYFKNPRRDMALTALAGPLSNFIMAFAGVLLLHIFATIFYYAMPEATGYLLSVERVVILFCSSFAVINVSLGIFNLIPVPPLDGSRIFLSFLPPKYYFGIMKYERYIMIGLMVMLWTGIFSTPLSWAVNMILSGMEWVVTLIPFIA